MLIGRRSTLEPGLVRWGSYEENPCSVSLVRHLGVLWVGDQGHAPFIRWIPLRALVDPASESPEEQEDAAAEGPAEAGGTEGTEKDAAAAPVLVARAWRSAARRPALGTRGRLRSIEGLRAG